jgi:hypothetical protein
MHIIWNTYHDFMVFFLARGSHYWKNIYRNIKQTVKYSSLSSSLVIPKKISTNWSQIIRAKKECHTDLLGYISLLYWKFKLLWVRDSISFVIPILSNICAHTSIEKMITYWSNEVIRLIKFLKFSLENWENQKKKIKSFWKLFFEPVPFLYVSNWKTRLIILEF